MLKAYKKIELKIKRYILTIFNFTIKDIRNRKGS